MFACPCCCYFLLCRQKFENFKLFQSDVLNDLKWILSRIENGKKLQEKINDVIHRALEYRIMADDYGKIGDTENSLKYYRLAYNDLLEIKRL